MPVNRVYSGTYLPPLHEKVFVGIFFFLENCTPSFGIDGVGHYLKLSKMF